MRAVLPAHRVEAARFPMVDAHAHLGRWLTGGRWAVDDVGAFVALLDAANVRTVVNFDGRWGEELEANLDRYDRRYPGRFVTFCHVDWAALRHPDAGRRLVAGLERALEAGARGLKVWKDLGLHVRDGQERLVGLDDDRLHPLWEAAGRFDVPVAIHTADPVAFFDPVDEYNERLEELLAHPDWSYADPRFPRFEQLVAALETVVGRHPGTRFVGVHVGCFAEDLRWVGRMLDTYPNFAVDIGERIAELGRQPRSARALLVRHAGRVLAATDGIPPDAGRYRTTFRFLETADEAFPYSEIDPPPTGRWSVSGLDLPDSALHEVYAGAWDRLTGTGPAGGARTTPQR
jgi:predicted TIM-barrel fold metal-dependent hydrolase